ncbi:uncharacterized protein LOC9639299 [Selaginella moellendorffii]|uniref:uncharacterized protein LOC9639299 n=1 Tax=Selaginella moellendorffii TaxID=88036 RepID=UPI000D1C7715|nr:uncharacterized protein LOC9639299 [Selaginella moellendorffii]|eukprot:XP_024518311.1 uncharacterized protein LOC9639299 [Selaginella moellendorffii]
MAMDSDRWSEGEPGGSMRSRTWSSMRSREEGLMSVDEVESPFPGLEVDLSASDLRETAYEVLVCATVVNEAISAAAGSKSPGSPHSPAHFAVRRLKKALTIKSRRRGGVDSHSRDLDIARSQMEISERRDGRIRKALSRAAEHSGNRLEALLVPLELLANLSSSDFSNSQEYRKWQKRQLTVLEAGLLVYPARVHESSDAFAAQFRKAVSDIRDRQSRGSKLKEGIQALRAASTGLAGGDECHWASGFPLNVHLYDMLLRSLFDSLEEGSFIFEIDQMMDLVKKTWGILGITEFLHHVCFMWVLFRQFIVTGQVEAELLRTAEVELREARRSHPGETSLQSDLLSSVLTSIQGWSEMRLLSYHVHFTKKEVRAMDGLASLSILVDEVLNEHVLQEAGEINSHIARLRSDEYIQGSVQACFTQVYNNVLGECGQVCSTALVELAKNVAQLASDEEENFSPIFKQWHPCPARLAASTLHTCYTRELKYFMSKSTEPTKDVLRALESAAMLEKKLMRMCSESSLNSGEFTHGSSIAADAAIDKLVSDWLEENLQKLAEWVHRNVQQEDWSSDALREHYAMSGVEVLRMVEDLLDAFFALPVYENPNFLRNLISGVSSVLERYAFLTVAGCEPKEVNLFSERKILTPSLLKSSSLLNRVGEVWKKRSETLTLYRNKVWPQLNEADAGDDVAATDVEHLCVRMNTLYYIETQMEFLEKKIRYGWQELTSGTKLEANEDVKFSGARHYCQNGIQKLCEFIAYQMVFCDMRDKHWEVMYSSKHYRIKPAIDYLNTQLLKVAESSSDWLRDRLVKHIMKASFEAFVQVASHQSKLHAVEAPEVEMYEEEFDYLVELFKAGGEGLQDDLVDRTAEPVLDFLKLLLIKPAKQEQIEADEEESRDSSSSPSSGGGFMAVVDFEANLRVMFTKSSKSPPVPQGLQHLTNTNVLATALGYRCHSMASKFVKKSFDFSKV